MVPAMSAEALEFWPSKLIKLLIGMKYTLKCDYCQPKRGFILLMLNIYQQPQKSLKLTSVYVRVTSLCTYMHVACMYMHVLYVACMYCAACMYKPLHMTWWIAGWSVGQRSVPGRCWMGQEDELSDGLPCNGTSVSHAHHSLQTSRGKT